MYVELDREEQAVLIFLFESENNRATLEDITAAFEWEQRDVEAYLNDLTTKEFVEGRIFKKNEPVMFSLTSKGREYFYDQDLV